MTASGLQDRRLAAIAAAAAAVLSETEYQRVRTQDVAARVRLDAGGDGRSATGKRSAVWLYNEVRSRRVLVALAARQAWDIHLAQAGEPPAPADPETVADACRLVGKALLRIARFHRSAHFLMRQVGFGIGDIATSEKRSGAEDQSPPTWPDSAWGRVAADGFAGRCGVFADYLEPVLAAAARAACPMPAEEARAQARTLSDLAFRALTGDPEGPLDRIADGLAAYWFERDLVRTAGRWVQQVQAAERGVAGRGRRAMEPRARAVVQGVLTDVLLETGTLFSRCAAEGRALIELLTGATETESKAGDVSELRVLCDAASRHGLVLQRLGDLGASVEAHHLARGVAERMAAGLEPEEADSYAARSDHNLADVALDLRDLARAEALSRSVLDRRRRLAAGGAAPARRRYSLTVELRARVDVAAGRVVDAVVGAEKLVGERIVELGGAENTSVAAARLVLGEALIQAGHPLEARHHLEIAHLVHTGKSATFSLAVQRDLALLAEASLMLDAPAAALDLLPDDDAVAWMADHVSFRLMAVVQGLRATAAARLDRLAEAEHAVARAAARFPDPGPGRVDPVLPFLERCRAEILWRAGDVAASAAVLAAVRAVEEAVDAGRFSVASATTLRRLARCADATGDFTAASGFHDALRAGAESAIDPTHVEMLRADLDQARRLQAAGDIDGAGRWLARLLDRRPLAHGRPAVQEGHPLLAAARRLADRIGYREVAAAHDDWGEE